MTTTGGLSVELTEDDAKLFLLFRRHQDVFAAMIASGVFNVRNGHAELHFDKTGLMRQITLQVTPYEYHKEVLTAVFVPRDNISNIQTTDSAQ